MISKYIKKPVVIEAIQLTMESYNHILKWCGDSVVGVSPRAHESMLDFDYEIVIKTLE